MEYRCLNCDRVFDYASMLQIHKRYGHCSAPRTQPARTTGQYSFDSTVESAELSLDFMDRAWCNVYVLIDNPYNNRIRIFYDYNILPKAREKVFKDTVIAHSTIAPIVRGIDMNDTSVFATLKYKPWVEKVDNEWIHVKPGGKEFIWWTISAQAADA